jgi:hypothetical protein
LKLKHETQFKFQSDADQVLGIDVCIKVEFTPNPFDKLRTGPPRRLCFPLKLAIYGAASFPLIPTGLRPPAQGWPSATASGLPWVLGPCAKQPHRGCAQMADEWRNTFGVENAFLNFVARVGRASQPWALGQNPVGIRMRPFRKLVANAQPQGGPLLSLSKGSGVGFPVFNYLALQILHCAHFNLSLPLPSLSPRLWPLHHSCQPPLNAFVPGSGYCI